MTGEEIKICIAEKHLLIRKAIIGTINNFPNCIVVVDAENGEELIKKLNYQNPRPSICILDIQMHQLNGYDTLISLRKIYPEMRFLILTIVRSEFSVTRMIRSGANGYLYKGCSPEDLNNAIVDIHFKGYHYSKMAPENLFKNVNDKKLFDLTPRELTFLKLSCSYLTYIEIGKCMHISPRSVEYYHQNLSHKLCCRNRLELALFAIQSGLVPIDRFNETNY